MLRVEYDVSSALSAMKFSCEIIILVAVYLPSLYPRSNSLILSPRPNPSSLRNADSSHTQISLFYRIPNNKVIVDGIIDAVSLSTVRAL